MSEKDRIEGRKFLEKHFRAQVGKGRLRFNKIYPVEYWSLVSREPFTADSYRIEYEESVDVSLRESDFERLLDILGYFRTHNQHDSYYRDLEQKLVFERKMREQHPALKKAYDRYRLLLTMVANGQDIDD
jgi:hypothetical protein